MPEIIEVKHTADLIRRKLKKKKIIKINILAGRYKKKKIEGLIKVRRNLPLLVKDVKTKGKMLYIIFSDDIYLVSKLGLVGNWIYKDRKGKNYKYIFSKAWNYYKKYGDKKEIKKYTDLTLKHLNVELVTKDGSLYYSDMLSYGTMQFVFGKENLDKILDKIGPDIMDPETTLEIFKKEITNKNNLDKNIGNVLVNQKYISGMGNYLRAEILYLSKINPFRKVRTLSNREINKLYRNSKLLTWGIYNPKKAQKMGILQKNSILPSKYNRLFFVYTQDFDIYGNEVISKNMHDGGQKRLIYYVKEIQK